MFKSLFVFVCTVFALHLFAQQEGMIVYEMVNKEISTEDNRINNVKIEVAYSGDMSQMKIFIGAKIDFTWLVREKGAKGVRFSMQLDSQRLLVDDYPLDSIIAMKHKTDDWNLTFVKNEEKKILKHKCKKAILQSAVDRPVEFFIATKLHPKISIFDKLFKGIKGVPLEFTLTTISGQKMTFQAKWIYAKVADKTFVLSSNYKRISYKAFRKKMGSIGFGF